MVAREGEITARQAAKVLGVHARTVRRWCREGRFEHSRVTPSGRFYLSREEVERQTIAKS